MEINKETFTVQDLKQLLKEAFEFDYDKHKGKVKFYPFTIVEWHKSDVFKNELSFDNIKGNIVEWSIPFNTDGTYFQSQKSIVVFLKDWKLFNFKDVDYLIIWYVIVMFHELNHHYQDLSLFETIDTSEIDLSTFSMHVEWFVRANKSHHYIEHHDEYLIEIDSNLYGVNRAFEFLEKQGLLTEKRRKILRLYENRFLFVSNNYDMHAFFHECYKIIKENSEISRGDYGILELFYDNNHKFRPINEILELNVEWELDKQILNIFFSSKDFLDSLGFSSFSLSLEHKQIIMNSIEYALEIEINRRKKNREFLQNRQINSRQYLDVDAGICNKIAYLNKKKEEFKRLMEIPIMNCNLDEEPEKRR